ncbi:MAG: hypothetical protein KF812_04290 [Fimbriimonadaceae bacterium]|nr:hypothetical protein [Fimbriimonadaceae bacterium]
MSDSTIRPEPLRQDAASEYRMPDAIKETEFEKPRGINRVEVRKGLARVHVSRLSEPLAEHRLLVLRAVADAQISIDFLKFTPTGLSFIVPISGAEVVETALRDRGWTYSLKPDRSVVLVHAVNMRDEVGLMAQIIAEALTGDAVLEHLGDMHDRLLVVLPDDEAEALAERLRAQIGGEA